jgi:2,3-dihydroxyphenylpropionate 1,2-dioxygenase
VAKITLGIGASHTTLMNTSWAKVDHLLMAHDFKNGLHIASEELHAQNPDAVIVVGSNHFRGHWLDLMPGFTIGVDDIFSSGEHGTPSGPQKAFPEISLSLANHLVDNGFDMAFSTHLVIDHGISHAIQYLTLQNKTPIVPLMVNCFAPPLPKLDRCIQLGLALRDAIGKLPNDLTVAIIASGGLSHQLPFPDWREPQSADDEFLVDSWKNGRGDWKRYEARRREIIVNAPSKINELFDRQLLNAFCNGQTQEWLSKISEDDLVEIAGNGANEIRNWLIMHAAMDFCPGKTIAYSPISEWLTGMGVFLCKP